MKVKRIFSTAIACAVMASGVLLTSATLPVLQASALWGEDYTEGTYEALTYRAYSNRIEIIDCDEVVTEVVIPEEIDGLPVTVIASEAFYNCKYLSSITLPDTILSIRDYAFSDCRLFTSITIPKNVINIGVDICRSCDSLTEFIVDDENTAFSSLDGVLFNKDKTTLLQCPKTKSGEYTIPNGVEIISTKAFANCQSLRFINIPDSVSQLGEEAFYQCYFLRRITLPENITYIPNRAFYYCSSLAEITLPDGITSIRSDAFSGCHELAEITIPDGATYIYDDAFGFCKNLDDVIIPASVTSIGLGAFNSCNSLDNVIILNPECEIGDHHSTISNYSSHIYYGTIYGYEGSTAQAYAEKYERTFIPLINGDADLDGELGIADVVKIMVHTTTPGGTLSEIEMINADVYQTGDGISNMDALAVQKKIAQLISELPESELDLV